MIMIIIAIVVVYLLFIKSSTYTLSSQLPKAIKPAGLGGSVPNIGTTYPTNPITSGNRPLVTTFGPERMCAVMDYINANGLTLGTIDTTTGKMYDSDFTNGHGFYPSFFADYANDTNLYDTFCSNGYNYPYAISVCDVYDMFIGLCNGARTTGLYNAVSMSDNTTRLGDNSKLCATSVAGVTAQNGTPDSLLVGLFAPDIDIDLFQQYCYKLTPGADASVTTAL